LLYVGFGGNREGLVGVGGGGPRMRERAFLGGLLIGSRRLKFCCGGVF